MHETRTLSDLLSHGERAATVVVEIHVGAKGSKKAVFEFTTTSGETVRARDLFQMYLVRHAPGDVVTALYAPSMPTTATIDLGRWTWQEPGLLCFSFAFFLGRSVLIWAHRPSPPRVTDET